MPISTNLFQANNCHCPKAGVSAESYTKLLFCHNFVSSNIISVHMSGKADSLDVHCPAFIAVATIQI